MEPTESELEVKVNNGSHELDDYFALGKIYSERGELSRLLELYDKAMSRLPSEEGALIAYHKGTILNQMGRSHEAVSCFEGAVQMLSDSKESELALTVRGMSHFDLSHELAGNGGGKCNAKLALAELEKLIREYPDCDHRDRIYEHIGDLHFRLKQFDSALEAYRQGVEASSEGMDKISCLLGIAGVYWKKRDRIEAEQVFQQALDLAEGGAGVTQIYYCMGKMYYEAGWAEEAGTAFENALKNLHRDPYLKHNPQYVADIYWHIGSMAYDRYEYPRAVSLLSRVLDHVTEDHPYFCDTHITLGHCHLGQGYFEKAREHYNAVLFSPKASPEEIAMADECLKEIGGETVV